MIKKSNDLTWSVHFVLLLLSFLSFSGIAVAKILPAAQEQKTDPVILIPPFADESGFTGRWKLSDDLPRYLSSFITEKFHITVILPASVQLFGETIGVVGNSLLSAGMLDRTASHFKARYIITATITEFSVGRFIVAEQKLAGYEAFSADVKFTFKVYDARKLRVDVDKALLTEEEAVGAVRDRGLGITLFGKQTERTNQYFSLDELLFGGEKFNKTVIGEAMAKAAGEFATKLGQAIPELQLREMTEQANAAKPVQDTTFTLHRKILNGEILVVDSLEVFINLGSDDGLVVGGKIPVFAKGEQLRDPKTQAVLGESDLRVGEIQIIEVRAPHLSLCVITKGAGSIAPHQKVRVNVVR